MKNVMSDMGIFEPIKNGCLQVLTWFENMIRGIKKLWNDFKRWLGMSVKDMGVDSKTINKLQKDVKTT